MKSALAVVTTLAVLLAGTLPSVAQPQPADGVLDVLADVFGPIRTVRGQVVQHREATLVLRGEDGRTYTINTAGLDTSAVARLKEGRQVSIVLKPGSSRGAMPIASAVESIEIQPSAAVAGRARERVHGYVDSVGLGTLVLKTDRGATVTVETTQLTEPVRVRPGDLVTIVGRTDAGHGERFVAEQILTDRASTPPASPATGP